MSRPLVTDNPSYAEWNAVLDRSTDGNFQQAFEYGEVMRRAIPRTEVLRLIATDNGHPIGIVQGIYRARFGFGGNLMVGGVSGGAPLTCATEEDKKTLVIQNLLEALEQYAKEKRIIESRVYWTESWGLQRVFHSLRYDLASSVDTFRVDLTKPVDQLWGSISHNFRRKVKQAMRADVQVAQAENHDDLLSFHGMVKEAAKRHGFGPPPLEEYEAIWDIYRPKKLAWIFLAKWKGKDVAGVQVIAHSKTLQAASAGSLEEAWSVRPTDILHWKVMEWAHEQGFSWYNLGGALTPGLVRWKEEFGGRRVRICKYDKVFLPNLKKTIGRAYGVAMTVGRLIKQPSH